MKGIPMLAPLTGLIAAAYTPLDASGKLRFDPVPGMVDRLIDERITGLYVCGSTGEGVSFTGEERRATAEAFVRAAGKRIPILVQVGHNSVWEAASLAAHAQEIGADALSATAPSYFKGVTLENLVASMAEIAAAAPDLPFYYYHIPFMTGLAFDMVEFLKLASEKIPSLAGIKYSAPTVHEFQACKAFEDGRFDILWGCDEMLLSAFASGARGAVGSTYNFAAPLYNKIIEAFNAGRSDEAQQLQLRSVELVRALCRYPFLPATKQIMTWLGDDCGPARLPLPRMTAEQIVELRTDLESIGFFEWGRNA